MERIVVDISKLSIRGETFEIIIKKLKLQIPLECSTINN